MVPLHGCPLLCTTKAKFPIYSQANCETLKCGDPLHFLKTCVQDSIIILAINYTTGILTYEKHVKNILETYNKHRSFKMLSVCLPYVCHRFRPHFRHMKMAVSYVCKHMNNTSKHTNYIWPLTSGGASRLKNTPTTK